MVLRALFDSDGGVDDAAALWWACTSPDVEVVAVTAVAGNVDAARAASNLATVLAAAGRAEVPIAIGPSDPVGPIPPLRRAAAIHGQDGLGDAGIAPAPLAALDEPAPELLARSIAARPGELTIVATGPLSNVARALALDPAMASHCDLVVMGGSARAGGNARPAAEANFAHDPTAAARVVGAGWARPPLMVGLDVTLTATLTDAEFDLLATRASPAAAFLAAPLAFYRRRGSTFSAPGECPCHDLLAFMAAAHPGLVRGPVLPLAVDTGGSAAWGASVVDFRELAFARLGATPEDVGSGGDDGSGGGNDESVGGRWTIGLDVDVEGFRQRVRALFGG